MQKVTQEVSGFVPESESVEKSLNIEQFVNLTDFVDHIVCELSNCMYCWEDDCMDEHNSARRRTFRVTVEVLE